MGVESSPGTLAGATEHGSVLALGELLRVLRNQLWIILLVATVLAGTAMAVSFALMPKYDASIKLLVGQERGISDTPNEALGLQQLTLTMTDLAHSHRVAEAVIRQERLSTSSEDFLKNLSVEQVPNTQDIEVAYTDTDPERAQRVVNAVGEVFSREVAEVSQSTNAITATLWDRAAVPEEPVSPIPLLNGLLALLLGLMLGVGLAFLLEYLDDSWRSPEEVEQLTGVPTYGVIPTMAFSKDKEGQG